MLNILFFSMLLISFITDVRSRKILNIITFPMIVFGLFYHSFASGVDGLVYSLLGLLLGFALLFIPYLLDGMGAGDVKLMAAIGAMKGSSFVFGSFLYTAIVGGLIALVILLSKKEFVTTIRRVFFSAQLRSLSALNKDEYHHAFPYGIAIVIGTALHFGVSYL